MNSQHGARRDRRSDKVEVDATTLLNAAEARNGG